MLLRELLKNLLGNAWKFTGCRSAVIEVGVTDDSSQSVFFVRDNGIGFGVADAQRLFEPFTKLHSPSAYEGNGIGLAIARNIVAAHGGYIWAQGRPGDGATFYFTLAQANARCTPASRSLFDFRCGN